jgi:hypothetical protein
MPLAYPLDLRTLADTGIVFRRPVFTLEKRIAVAALPQTSEVMEIAPAAWRASFRTVALDHLQEGRVMAFLEALAGAKRFLAHDMAKPWPVAHLAGAGLAGPTLTVSALTPSRVALTGATGLTLTAGDRIGLEKASGAPRHALFRVLETTTAGGGGIAFDVAPMIPSWFAVGDVCRLHRPVCPMILDPGQQLAPPADLLNRVEVAFSAIQAAQ